MRLHGLHTLAALDPELRITVTVAAPLQQVAEIAFGSRLSITPHLQPRAFAFSHLGIRDLAKGRLTGRRYIQPFHLTIRNDRAAATIKDRLNDLLFEWFAQIGGVLLPDRKLIETYHGWYHVSALPAARQFEPGRVRQQMMADLPGIRANLSAIQPRKVEDDCVIFPSGSSFQVMPAALARERFSNCVFAFHKKDGYQAEFAAAGLKIALFDSPLEILQLASKARRTVCTDSFPSHLLQSYSEDTVITLSHYPRGRIVHPSFKGCVVESAAPCCPCVTRARKGSDPRCPAGHPFCITWNHPDYLRRLSAAIEAKGAAGFGDG